MPSVTPQPQHLSAPAFAEQRLDSVSQTQRLLHELQVHQIELQMQNEALQDAHRLAETSLAHYTELYEFSPAACFTLSPAGQVLQANLAAMALLGLDGAQVVGQAFAPFLQPVDQISLRALLQLVFAGQSPQPMEAVVSTGSEAPRHVQIDVRLQPQGHACLLTAVDITDRAMLSLERQRVHDLSEAYQAAEAATQAKSAFLSCMSHELRTPLNAILGFAQLLQMDRLHPLDSRQVGRVQAVQVAGQHLLSLVEDVLDLSLIEAGGLRVDCGPIDLEDVLDDACKLVATMLQTDGVSLLVDAGGHHRMVHADKMRLTQVLVNLLSNAIKYNVKSGVVRVEITQPCSDRLNVAVIDTGPGMTPEQQAQLFQPFNRLGREQSEVAGTGIGLVITQRLLALMGGGLAVQSTVGKGSRFEVRLPLALPVLN